MKHLQEIMCIFAHFQRTAKVDLVKMDNASNVVVIGPKIEKSCPFRVANPRPKVNHVKGSNDPIGGNSQR